MKQSRLTEAQILEILRAHQAGEKVADLLRRHGISENTFYRWKSKYAGMDRSAVQRLQNRSTRKYAGGNMLDPGGGMPSHDLASGAAAWLFLGLGTSKTEAAVKHISRASSRPSQEGGPPDERIPVTTL